MGERGNIGITQYNGKDRVFLYTHWSGYGVCKILAEALDSPFGRRRANDAGYLTRIIYDHLTKEQAPEHRETGFGITANCFCDNSYPVPVVNPETQTVLIMEGDSPEELKPVSLPLSYAEFIRIFKNIQDDDCPDRIEALKNGDLS